MSIKTRLKKLEDVLAPKEETRLEVVFVKVGQTSKEAIKLKYGEDGRPDGVRLLVVQFVAPDPNRFSRNNSP